MPLFSRIPSESCNFFAKSVCIIATVEHQSYAIPSDMQTFLLQGRVSVSDMIGSELMPSKAYGSSKSCDSSFDPVNFLKQEIGDTQLNFRGKRVLEYSPFTNQTIFVSRVDM
ncbi:hypothetical protein CTI12_AA267730 [Artemisia annua]|uniref:Uncharacterized protein n=1 Tax=Artemisia annua TaxID=35608 RepID=A0A2U1NGG5_ARTAN|nr:hypothetical protein CTI12_AA267730 [Artemisia annua]